MDEYSEGAVKLKDVLLVLKSGGVSVLEKDKSFILSKDNVIKVVPLSGFINRQMIHALSRWFDIEIYLFYHPEYL